jgi:two-component system response regulator CpxR
MAVVLLSRGTMSGVTLLVDRLCRRTGVRCVSRENLVELVNRHGALARRVLEQVGNATREYDDFCELRRPYLILMRAALLEYAAADELIYHGFSGHLLVPPVAHFRTVRIHAPVEMRVEMTMDRLGCDADEARRYIERDDDDRVRWARFMYGKDIRDPSLYDVCVNLQRMSISSACNVIQSLIDDPECQATAASQAAADEALTAARVEAALVTDPRTESIEASARVTDGRVIVTGPYLDEIRHAAVLELARGVRGVTDVEYRYGFAPAFAGA